MSKEIIFVTGNENKLKEVRAITKLNIIAKKIDIPEIQSLLVEEVAKAKALEAFKIVGKPVLVDDTGMNIEALGGLPGALITWFLGALKPVGIVNLLSQKKNRKASVTTCVAYADQKGVYTFSGSVQGKIAQSAKGKSNFGYDPIFIPKGYTKTYAELGSEEKNKISMRKIALLKFKKFLLKKV